MKILLVIYAISWCILLIIWGASFLKKKENNPFKEKEPWYLYALIFILAPFTVIMIPFILVNDWIKDKKYKKKEEERKAKEDEENRMMAEKRMKFRNACNQDGIDATVPLKQIEIAHKLFSLAKARKYNEFMNCLNELSLPTSLSLDVLECEKRGSGDNSRLCVTGDFEDLKIFDHITVEDSCDGAWQVFLLNNIWHVLPFFWHGGYNKRSYLFSEDDISSIEMFRKDDFFVLSEISNFDVKPKIIKYEDNYYVSCCYWTDWGGLKRELVVITINNGKATNIQCVDTTTIVEYDCGIMF